MATGMSTPGDISGGSRLFVTGDTNMGGRVFSRSDASFGGNLFVPGYSVFAGDVSMNSRLFLNAGALIVGGASFSSGSNSFSTDVNISGNLSTTQNSSVTNDSTVGQRLFVGGDQAIGGNLNLSGDASMNSRLFLGSDVSTSGRLFVGRDVSMSGNLFTAGRSIYGGDASLNTRFFVGGDASFGGNMVVVGRTTYAGDVSINTRLFVAGDVSFGSRIFSLGDVSFAGNTFVGSQLVGAGDASLNAQLFVGKDVSFGGNLYVNRDVMIAGRLTVRSYSSINNVTITNTTVNYSTLFVNEDLSLNGRFFASSDISMAGNLFVDGAAVFDSDVSMNSRLFLNTGALYIGGSVLSGATSSFSTDVSASTRLFVGGDASFGGNINLYNSSSSYTISPNSSAANAGPWTGSDGTIWYASASAAYASNAYNAFDNENGGTVAEANGSRKWLSLANYNSSGNYSGTTNTYVIGQGTIAGEWIQIGANKPLTMVNYSIATADDTTRNPRTIWIVGSNDVTGVTWYPIQAGTFTSSGSNTTYGPYTPSFIGTSGTYSMTTYGASYASSSFQNYRMIVPTTFSNPNGNFAAVEEWFLTFNVSGKYITTTNLITNTVSATSGNININSPAAFSSDLFLGSRLIVANNLVLQSQYTSTVVSPNTPNANAGTWYNNGVLWTASSSANFSGVYAYNAFDATNASSNKWLSATSLYSSGTGAYIGSKSTTVTGQGTIQGEWIQIQSSFLGTINNYSIGSSDDIARNPKTFWIVGTNDVTNTTWYPIYSGTFTSNFSSYANAGPYTVTTGTQGILSGTQYSYYNTAYNFFRLIITSSVSANLAAVGDWTLNFNMAVPYLANTGGFANLGNFIQQGDISMNSRLFVGGDISANARFSVVGDISANSRFFIGGDASMGGNLFVGGRAINRGDISANSRLFLTGDASMTGNLFTGGRTIHVGDVSTNTRLFIGGDASMTGNLFTGGRTINRGDVSMNSRLFLNTGALYVGGSVFSGATSSFTTDVSASARLFVGGDASFGGNVFVIGNTIQNGNISINNNLFLNSSGLNLTGDIQLGQNLFLINDLSCYSGNIFTPGFTSTATSTTPAMLGINPTSFSSNTWVSTSISPGIGTYGISISTSLTGQYAILGCVTGIYYTTNYGTNWINNNFAGNLVGTAMSSSGQYAIASQGNSETNSGNLYYSTNFGINWQTATATPTNWLGVAMNSTGEYAYACNWNGATLWQSTNYGMTWNSISIAGTGYPNPYSICVSATGQYVVFTGSVPNAIFYSTAYGQNWKSSDMTTKKFYNLAMSYSGQYVIAGSTTNSNVGIYYSSSYGIYWSSSNITSGGVGTTNNLAGSCAMSFTGQYALMGLLNSNWYYSTSYGVYWSSYSGSQTWYGFGMSLNGQYAYGFQGGTIYNKIMSLSTTTIVPATYSYPCGLTTFFNDVSFGSRVFLNTGALYVGGSAFTGASSSFTTDVSMNARFFVGGDASMNSRLFVGGDASITANLITGGRTIQVGDVSINTRLFVGGDTSLAANLAVGGRTIYVGDVSMNSRLFVGGDVSMNSQLFVSGDASMNSRLFVGQALYANNLSERIATASSTTFDYTTGSIFYIASPSSSNFTANFINIPSTLNQTFVVTLVILASTNKVFGNAITVSNTSSVNGSTSTLYFNGGVNAVSVSNASLIIQSFAIMNINSVATYVVSNVASYQ